jgi:hypothetical protein
MIEKLGRDQIGRRHWNKLSEEEKIQETTLSDPSEHEEGLKDSNSINSWQSWLTCGRRSSTRAYREPDQDVYACTAGAVAGGIANHVFSVYQMTKA